MGKRVGPVLETHTTILEEMNIPVPVVEIMEIILVIRKMLIAQIVLDIEVIEIILHTVIEIIVMQDTEESRERIDTTVVRVIEKWRGMRTLNQSYQGILNR